MPRVPEYESQVALRGVPNPGAPYVQPPAAFGSTLGAAGVALSNSLADVYLDTEIAAAKEVETGFRRSLLELGMGQNGYYLTQGKQAVEGYEKYGKDVDQLYQDSLKQLGSGVRARIGGSALERVLLQEAEQSRKHQVQQGRVYADEASLGRQEVVGKEGTLHWNSDQKVAEALAEIQSEVIERGMRAGKDRDAIQADIIKAHSPFLAATIGTAAAYDPKRSLELFGRFRNFLDDATLNSVSQGAMQTARKAISIDLSASIIGEGGDFPVWLKKARNIEDDDIRESTLTLLRQQHADNERGKDEAQSEGADRYWNQILRDPLTFNPDDIPTDGQLNPSEVIRMRSYIESYAKGEASAQSDNKFMQWALLSEEEKAAANLNQWLPEMLPGDGQNVIKQQRKAKGEQDVEGLSRDKITSQMLLRLDAEGIIDDHRLEKLDEEDLARATMALRSLERELPNKPSFSDVDDTINRLLKQQSVGKGGFIFSAPTLRTFEIEQGAVAVPRNVTPKLDVFLRKKGVSEEGIRVLQNELSKGKMPQTYVDLYLQMLRGEIE